MGEDYELEEGEMNCSSDEAVVDPDVDLSYIDKKVQDVLGHLQKDFEEGSLDLFAPTVGDYGSFLPTYKRSLAVPVSPFQRSSLGNHAIQRFSNSLPGKEFQSLLPTSCKLVNHDPQNYQTSRSLLAQAPGKVPIKVPIKTGDAKLPGNDFPIKTGDAKLPGNDLSDHKPIRVRIKMGSEILAQKVTRVCKDLGLNDSSRMLPHTSLEKTSESPSRILQEMTAISVPEDLLMSPLPDSLLLVKDKEKQYSLLENPLVLKAGKEPPIQTPNTFSDVLGCDEAPNGKRRKVVDCFDATNWIEASSISETMKQKVVSTGQRGRDNQACGLGGASSTNDRFTSKRNLQEGIKKDGENDPRAAFAKTNKIKAVGVHAVKEKKTCPTKLQQNSSKNCFKDNFLSKMQFNNNANIGHNSMDIGFDFAVAPSSTSLDLENWAQCDSCDSWRILPYGLKPEELPDKWLCSMQTWLPGMNYCGNTEEETSNAIKALHANMAHGPGNGVKVLCDASEADKIYQPLSSGSLPNTIRKKYAVNKLSQGVSSNILVDAAKPLRSKHVFKIKNMMLSGKTPNATQISTELGVSHDLVQDKIDQKAKWQSVGTGSQIKIKKENEADKQESNGSQHMKTVDGNKLARDIKAEEIHWNQDPEWTPAERKTKRHDNDFYNLDVERGTKKRLLASKKKPDHKPQLTTGSGSSCIKAHGRINSLVRKIRVTGFKQGKNESNSKLFADGEEKEPSMKKAIPPKISVQESKSHKRNELFQADGSQEYRNADASCRYFSVGSGQISGVKTSSSSEVLGSHKSGRMYVEEVKASPLELVSFSPERSSCPTNLASAGESIYWKKQNMKYGDAESSIVNNGKPPSQAANCEILSTTYPRNRKQPKPEVCKQNSKFGDLACSSMKTVFENRAGIKYLGAIAHETMDRSSQAANAILQEAEKLKKHADCFKSSGFDYEYKETNFKAALRFLFGASLLEMCTDNVEGGMMGHVEAYRTAAKLSESCACQYVKSQEMAAAALAYKISEVAYMRLVYGRSLGLSGEWKELQKMVQMTPQGESPSSSASDVDSFSHQGVIDKSAKTKSGLSHVAGNLLPVARSQLNLVPLLDFAESMNLAMEALANSQNAFKAVTATSEETKHGDCISAIKKVIDFSFHDVEALIQMIEVAMDAQSPSRVGGPKC